jgi:hypothetical protein
MPLGTAWELVEGPGATTEVTVTFWAEPERTSDALRGRLGATGWYSRAWKRALKRLRELAESGAQPEPVRVAGTERGYRL